MLTRRRWIAAVGVTTMGAVGTSVESTTARTIDFSNPELPDSFPTTAPELAQQIVGASHFDLAKVEALLKSNPSLARASWDWGFGDWETAIGAASHMGRGDIIEVLIEHGATPTVFTWAALDQIDVVRAICVAHPGLQSQWGPHGITLLKHAEAGKANRVIDYLQELGGADQPQTEVVLSDAEKSPYIGTYDFGNGLDDAFVIAPGKTADRLGLRRGEGTPRFLACLKPHTFTVFGCQHVRVSFQVVDDVVRQLTVDDGTVNVSARRAG